MKKQVYHEGYNYVLEYDNNSLIMYKEDTDEWMGDIEYIKVFTIEGDTPRPLTLYRKLVSAANKLIAQASSDWFMFNVTDQKRADLYERFTKSIKGYSCQRADKYFYLYRIQSTWEGYVFLKVTGCYDEASSENIRFVNNAVWTHVCSDKRRLHE